MRIHTINKKNLSFKQRGALLAEIGMGVALISLLSLLGVMLIPGIVAGMNASKITNEMDSAVPKIQLAYTHRTSFATLTTEEVAKKRWMTDSFLERNGNVPTGRIFSKWGDITFAPAAGNNQGVGTLTAIPSRECNIITESFASNQYVSATVNGTSIKTATTALNQTTAGDQCNSSEANTVTFNFRR